MRILQSANGTEQMVRFANDSLTRREEDRGERRLGLPGQGRKEDSRRLDNTTEERLADFVERLHKTMVNLSKEPVYAPLPNTRRTFNRPGSLRQEAGRAREGTASSSPPRRSQPQEQRAPEGAPAPSRLPSSRATYSPRTGRPANDVRPASC